MFNTRPKKTVRRTEDAENISALLFRIRASLLVVDQLFPQSFSNRQELAETAELTRREVFDKVQDGFWDVCPTLRKQYGSRRRVEIGVRAVNQSTLLNTVQVRQREVVFITHKRL